jgi:hypothetical protein
MLGSDEALGHEVIQKLEQGGEEVARAEQAEGLSVKA